MLSSHSVGIRQKDTKATTEVMADDVVSDSEAGVTDKEDKSDSEEEFREPWSGLLNQAEEETQLDDPDDPVLFKDYLNYMETTVDKADEEYSAALKNNPARFNALSDDPEFLQYMDKTARKIFVPKTWTGILVPPIHIPFRPDMPVERSLKVRTISHTKEKDVNNELHRLRNYHLTASDSPIVSALVVAAKATAPFVRLCGDYRWVNEYVLITHAWIPNVLDTLRKLQGYEYYIDCDLSNAFHQLPLNLSTSEKLTILTPLGPLRPKFLPEGVAPASAILQNTMKQIFHGIDNHMLIIFDNMVIGANSLAELKSRFAAFVERCIEKNVYLKLSKSWFAVKSVNFYQRGS